MIFTRSRDNEQPPHNRLPRMKFPFRRNISRFLTRSYRRSANATLHASVPDDITNRVTVSLYRVVSHRASFSTEIFHPRPTSSLSLSLSPFRSPSVSFSRALLAYIRRGFRESAAFISFSQPRRCLRRSTSSWEPGIGLNVRISRRDAVG